MGRGLGFWAGEEIDGGGDVGREQVTCQRKKEGLTGGANRSARAERGRRTPLGSCLVGPWASFGAGPIRFPEALFLFLISFPFLFSLFISILLQFRFKSNQTRS
jgi:hypothetical protein